MTESFRIGEWKADVRSRVLSSHDETVRLETKAMAVLLEMAKAAPEPITIDTLIERVWSGVVVGDGSLYRVIALLRKTFGDNSRHPAYIESIPKLGYRLLAPVRFDDEPVSEHHNGLADHASHAQPAKSDKITLIATASQESASEEARLVDQVGKYVGWSSAAYRVLRTAPPKLGDNGYAVTIQTREGGGVVQISWELVLGPDQELLWASDHTEAEAQYPAKKDRIAELIAEGLAKEIRRHNLARWDGNPLSEHLGYWDLILLGDGYRSMNPKQVNDRRSMLRRAITEAPKRAPGYAAYADYLSWEVANGISADARQRMDQVRESASTAMDLDQDDPYVCSRCGLAYCRIGDYRTGLELCRRAFALAPSTRNKESLATSLSFAGEAEEALRLYEQILDSMPAGHVFQFGKLVIALVQAGRLEDALEYSHSAIIHFPRDYYCWTLHANLLAQQGRSADAEAAFERAKSLMPNVTPESVIDGTIRTYGRTDAQRGYLTDGLRTLSG